MTVEDGCITGGIGSTVAMYAANNGLNVKVKNIGIKDNFVPQGSIKEQYQMCGMTPEDIVEAIKGEL